MLFMLMLITHQEALSISNEYIVAEFVQSRRKVRARVFGPKWSKKTGV